MYKILINKSPCDLPDTTRIRLESLIQSRIAKVQAVLCAFLYNMNIGIAEATTVEDILEKVRTNVHQIYQSESKRVMFRPIKNAFIKRFQEIFPEIQFKTMHPRIDAVLRMIDDSINPKEGALGKCINVSGVNYRYGKYHEIVLFCRKNKDTLSEYLLRHGGIRKSWRNFCEHFNDISYVESRGWVLPKNIESVTKKSDKTFTEWISDILK